MCFTPIISLSTAILEWVLALILVAVFKKSRLTNLFAILLALLGGYQFSEYMLCTTGNLIWVKFGFLCYTFLPAVGLHSILNYFHTKKNLWLIYIIPLFFSIFSIIKSDFVLSGQCLEIFIQTSTLVNKSLLLGIPYALYYILFILIAFIILWKAREKARNKVEKEIYLLEMVGIILMTIPTFILIMILPPLGILFPSILCHFAVLLAILFFTSAYLDEKKSIHKKFHKTI